MSEKDVLNAKLSPNVDSYGTIQQQNKDNKGNVQPKVITSHDIHNHDHDHDRDASYSGSHAGHEDSYNCQFGCHFDQKTKEDIENARKARNKLIYASIFCIIFMIAEFVSGYVAHSVALMSDALHLLSDFGGFLISVVALIWAQKDRTHTLTFGYHRAEIIGALFSVFLIWVLTIWLVYEAITRLIKPEHVNGEIMFIVACCGIVVNIAMGMVLHGGHSHGGHHHGHSHDAHEHNHDEHKHDEHKHDEHKHDEHEKLNSHSHSHDHSDNDSHDHSHSHSQSHGDENKNKNKKTHVEQVNVRAALIHVIGDLVQSIGVLIAATLIWYDNDRFHMADPICTLIFSVIVMFTTYKLMGDILSVLMQSSPKDLDAGEIEKELKKLDNVSEVHDLHVWSLSLGKPTLSVHLLVKSFKACDNGNDNHNNEDENDPKAILTCTDHILRKAQGVLSDKFGIDHCTIQIEWPHDHKYHDPDFV